jgi:LysM repeat protein
VFEDSNEELEFWSSVPEGRFDRFSVRRQHAKAAKQHRTSRPVGSRSHDDTQSIPVVADPATPLANLDTPHVDPLLRRMGTMAVVIALLVPIALALRSGDEPARDAALKPQISTVAVSPAASIAADTAQVAAPAAAPAIEAAPVTTIDIDALPEAVPVHTEAPKAAAPKAATAGAGTASAGTSPARAATATAVATESASGQSRIASAPAARPTCTKTYTVKSGDAWISIAKRAGVTTKALLKANGATAKTAIHPGRDICLPADANMPAAATGTTPATAPATTAKPSQKSAAPEPKSTTTTAAPVPPARVYSRAEVTQIIREVWPDDLEEEAIRIATRESNLRPSAKNFCCYGLFQIYYNVHKGWLSQLGITSGSQLWDPRTNATAALALYARSNSFAPWNA